MTQHLPGIVFIGVVDCAKLQPNLPFDNASCECASEPSHGVPIETATLKFRTTSLLDTDIQLGFVITAVNGGSFLIGAAEPPYPMVSLTRKTGTPGGSPAAWEIEVKAVGRRVLLPCVF